MQYKIAVIIPCYCVKQEILPLLSSIGPSVQSIYVVDDLCPQQTGKFVEEYAKDPRISVIFNHKNLGVGGAVIVGFQHALADGADILVKLDGDGQMDPSILPHFTKPIIEGWTDYSKGNRFYNPDGLSAMPAIRIFGNTVLSFICKVSSGYWNVFDPTNGYLAISAKVARLLPFNKIDNHYFFESDMLFRLNTFRAVVIDVPMDAIYGCEVSNLKISRILLPFIKKHTINTCKRIIYNYFLRDMNAGSIELLFGLPLFLFGILFGIYHWYGWGSGGLNEIPATSGTVMLAALPTLLGIQFILSFIHNDIANLPRQPLHKLL